MARVICPFCFKSHGSTPPVVCPDSGETIPDAYVSEYGEKPPLWLVTIGFSNHGKTTYLAALTLVLEQIASCRPLDQYTIDKVQEIRREAGLGIVPDPTPTATEGFLRPLLFHVYDLPETGSRCMVMYDVAGEIYDSLSEVQKYMPAIKQANTTWFLVSLPDLKADSKGRRITDLFTVYLSGMERLRIDLSGRNLIVVYTKGDKPESYLEFRDYLRSDPFKGSPSSSFPGPEDFSLNDYAERIRDVSDQLEEYTRKRVEGGAAFIRMVRARDMNLAFCITSALGGDPKRGTKSLPYEDWLCLRVLDPFLWTITLERPSISEQIGLVLDASRKSGPVYDGSLLPVLWEHLLDYGELETYYLGQTSPASRPGQHPPGSSPRVARPRLIGPILEQAPLDKYFIVIGTGPIIDLADFRNSSWQEHILLVMLGEDHQGDWPNTIVYRTNDDPVVLVDALSRLRRGGKRQ